MIEVGSKGEGSEVVRAGDAPYFVVVGPENSGVHKPRLAHVMKHCNNDVRRGWAENQAGASGGRAGRRCDGEAAEIPLQLGPDRCRTTGRATGAATHCD